MNRKPRDVWIDAVMECPELNASARHVAHVIYHRLSNGKTSCFPGIASISRQTGMNRKTVITAIQRLETVGVLEIERSIGAANQYQIRDWSGSEKKDQTSTEIGTGTSTKNGTSTDLGTSTEIGTTPVPKLGRDQSQNRDSNHKTNHKTNHRGTRFALQQIPSAWKSFCEKERTDLIPENVFSEFRDYWIGVPGQKGVKLDWEATWRNWVRRQRTPDRFRGQVSNLSKLKEF